MGYNGYTEKKKITNARYIAKFKRIEIRVTEEEKIMLEQKAAEQGKSLPQYVKDLAING